MQNIFMQFGILILKSAIGMTSDEKNRKTESTTTEKRVHCMRLYFFSFFLAGKRCAKDVC